MKPCGIAACLPVNVLCLFLVVVAVAEPGPFMLVSGDKCVVSGASGLHVKDCLDAIASGSGEEVFLSMPASEGSPVVFGSDIVDPEYLGTYLHSNFRTVAVPEFSASTAATALEMRKLVEASMKRQERLLADLQAALQKCSGSGASLAQQHESSAAASASGQKDSKALVSLVADTEAMLEKARKLLNKK